MNNEQTNTQPVKTKYFERYVTLASNAVKNASILNSESIWKDTIVEGMLGDGPDFTLDTCAFCNAFFDKLVSEVGKEGSFKIAEDNWKGMIKEDSLNLLFEKPYLPEPSYPENKNDNQKRLELVKNLTAYALIQKIGSTKADQLARESLTKVLPENISSPVKQDINSIFGQLLAGKMEIVLIREEKFEVDQNGRRLEGKMPFYNRNNLGSLNYLLD